MSRRIVRREQACRDLVRHFVYLTEQADITTALRFQDSVKTSLELLSEMPELGSRRHFQNPRLADTRMWPIKEFREFLVFYQPIDDGIRVLRVIHAKEDYWRVLGE